MGTPDFRGSDHWAPFNFLQSAASLFLWNPCTVFSTFDMNQLRNSLFTDPPFIFLSRALCLLSVVALCARSRSRAHLALVYADDFQKNEKKNKQRLCTG